MWVFFFFKQKTAYEVRISDWSSDVCSSDLSGRTSRNGFAPKNDDPAFLKATDGMSTSQPPSRSLHRSSPRFSSSSRRSDRGVSPGRQTRSSRMRSEEHTSELQSLMRISYAVF